MATAVLAVSTREPRLRASRIKLGHSIRVLGGLLIVLVAFAIVAIGVGVVAISPQEIVAMVLQWLPWHPQRTWSATDLAIITQVRAPRIFTAILVGGSLAAAGTALQAVFRNSLADPGIIGTSAGASLGAVLALVSPWTFGFFGFGAVSLAAFFGALAATLLVYTLARVGSRVPSSTLLLAGFAVSALLNAIAAMLETLSDRVREVYAWLLGSLYQTTGDQIMAATPLMLVGILGLLAMTRSLNALVVGDEQAQYLGLNVQRQRLLILIFAAVLTSTAVALSGLIAFVGLIIPHIARILFGANHRLLVPASILLGAIFLICVDTIGRLAFQPQELPVGLVTAMIGAPWFLFLLRKKKGEYAF